MRAFAVHALGYDPGEPYNLEHVRVKIMHDRKDALVSYRNRVQELCVPDIGSLPVWDTVETWQPPQRAETAHSRSPNSTNSTQSTNGAPS